MIDSIKAWLWKATKVLAVFLGLYIFGDFRINDVNVKDFLQEQVPPAKLFAAKDWLVQMIGTAYEKFDKSLKDKTGYNPSSDVNVKDVVKKINEQEQQKMLEILKDNIDVESKLKTQQAKNEDLNNTLEDIAIDGL